MQQSKQVQRTKGTKRDSTKIKPKFQEQRLDEVNSNPLKPLNSKQSEYIDLLEEKPVVVALGYPGTSKTYIPTVMASDLFKLGSINKLIFTRPAISSSKSIGYFSGTIEEKLSPWLGAVLPILKERLGVGMYELALTRGDIEFVPLEVIKGMSISDAWLICEEASDLTKDEVIKIITRMGKNSTLVLAGDVRQSELKNTSGLVWLKDFIERHSLTENFGLIDFNSVDDIVRSNAVKQFITCIVRDEKKGIL